MIFLRVEKKFSADVINNNASKGLDEMKLTLKEQKIIFNKISRDTHNFHLNETLNKSNIEIGFKHGVRVAKIGSKKVGKFSENLIDLFDFDYFINEKEFLISPFILTNWTGKIYRNSEYFNKPSFDERMLLVCKDNNEIFYFTIIFNKEDDINRAYLTNHKHIKTFTKDFSRQELLVLYDENELKIMSTKPLALNEYPSDYFVIHKNRFFKHSGYSEPKIIIEENNKSRFEKNFTDKCYKAIKNALL